MYFDQCEQLFEDLIFNMLDLPLYYSKDCCSPIFTYTYSKGNEASSFYPKVNMYEDEKKYFVHVDLPGVTRDQVKMEINEKDRILTISGERVSTLTENKEQDKTNEGDGQTEKTDSESNENKKYFLKECSYGKFNRSITLPEKANLESIRANMENGLLEITIDKIEPPKTQKRTIEIQ